jgi:hypothetical protein
VPLPSLPRWAVWLALMIGVGTVGGRATLGTPNTFIERAAGQVLELGAAAAFAVAGLSGIASSLRKREWGKRTQDLAVLALERVEGELAVLAQQTHDILVGALPESRRRVVLEVRPAFRIPIDKVQRDYWWAAYKLVLNQEGAMSRALAPAEERLNETQPGNARRPKQRHK